MVQSVTCPGLGVGAAIPVFQPLAPDCCSIMPNIGDIALVSDRFLLHFLSRKSSEDLSYPPSVYAKLGYESYVIKSRLSSRILW